MKKIKILFISVLLLTTNGLFSCRKWLDKKPDTILSTPETLSDLQAMLDNGVFVNYELTPSLPECSSDNYFLFQATLDQSRDYSDPYSWQPFTVRPSNDWKSGYIPIYNVNVCLERIEDIPKTQNNATQWSNIKGSALFIRSYYFLQLLWAYSKAYDVASASTDLGIAVRVIADFNVPSVRANVQQSYDQVINDTKEAASLLPDISTHPLRPSRAAAYGLLARAYLSMRDYGNALKYSNLCLQISGELMDYNGDGDIINNIGGIMQPFRRFNKETIFYTEMNFNHPMVNPGLAKVDTMLYSEYHDNDLRKIAFFKPEANYQVFKGSYIPTSYGLFTGIATDEMYLTRAECLARVGNNGAGDKDAALADLATVLFKRWKTGTYNSPVISTASEALSLILNERRKELIFRGLRWMDIKRLNKEGYAITPKRVMNGQSYILPPNDNRYALPLPEEIVDITGMPQNPR